VRKNECAPIGIAQKLLKSASFRCQLVVELVPDDMAMVHLEGFTFSDELFEILNTRN
jgi:hypothetical protein